MGNGKNTYELIIDEMIKQIILRVYQPGEMLPSVRELAKAMQVNPNTIQKVYKYLEEYNFTFSQPGKGHYVNNDLLLNSAIEQHLQDYFSDSIQELRSLSLTDEKIKRIFLNVLGGIK